MIKSFHNVRQHPTKRVLFNLNIFIFNFSVRCFLKSFFIYITQQFLVMIMSSLQAPMQTKFQRGCILGSALKSDYKLRNIQTRKHTKKNVAAWRRASSYRRPILPLNSKQVYSQNR